MIPEITEAVLYTEKLDNDTAIEITADFVVENVGGGYYHTKDVRSIYNQLYRIKSDDSPQVGNWIVPIANSVVDDSN